MNNVLIKIYAYLPFSTSSEKNILDYIIKNGEKVVNMNVRQLAQATYTSPSTIIRLSKNLKYDGYSEFKKALIYDIAVKKMNEEQLVQDLKKDDNIDSIIEKITMRNVISIQNTAKLLNGKDIEKTVDLIEKSDNVSFFGMGSSLLVAKDASQKFLRVDKICHVFDDWHLQLMMAKNMTKSDFALIFSYSGQTEEMIECAEAVKKNGGSIVLVTGFENSPLSKLSDIILPVAATEYLFRSGAMASRISQMNVVDILYTAYINRNYEGYAKRISMTHIKKDLGE